MSMQTRIAIVGDSNVQADAPTGSVRGHLYPALVATGYSVAAVGTYTDDRLPATLRQHDGYNGLDIATARGRLPSLLAAHRPHVLIVWLGTRDLLPVTCTDVTRAEAPIRMAQFLADVRALAPATKTIVCTAPPCDMPTLPMAGQWITAYNAALAGVVAGAVGDEIAATLCDTHARINPANGLHDGVHLSDRGAQDASIALYQTVTGLLTP